MAIPVGMAAKQWQTASLMGLSPHQTLHGITIVATRAPAFARVSGLRSTFRSTNGKVNLGHV